MTRAFAALSTTGLLQMILDENLHVGSVTGLCGEGHHTLEMRAEGLLVGASCGKWGRAHKALTRRIRNEL